MAAELGADPVLCGFIGGETGTVLRPLLDELPGSAGWCAPPPGAAPTSMDRRCGERDPIAIAWSDPPTRHEIDDLVLAHRGVGARERGAGRSAGPCRRSRCRSRSTASWSRTARAGDTRTIVDLSPPRLNSALEGEPDFVKVSDWQLAEFVQGPVSTESEMRSGAEARPRGRRGLRDGHPRGRPGADRDARADLGADPAALRGGRAGGLRRLDGGRDGRDAGAGDVPRGGAALGRRGGCRELPAPRSRHRLARRWSRTCSRASSCASSETPNSSATGAQGGITSSPARIAAGPSRTIHSAYGAPAGPRAAGPARG